MLCIVQVFERAVSAPHANKEEVRSLLPANDSQPPSQTRTILEVMSQHELNQNGALALCSDEMGCIICCRLHALRDDLLAWIRQKLSEDQVCLSEC